MGALDVPATALWGAQTQRAIQNFPASGLRMPRAFIRAMGLIKRAAAAANADLGDLAPSLAAAIQAAALEVAQGRYDDQFPLDVFQTGSGTSSNMNANEVIAALAGRSLGQTGAPERSREHESEQQRRRADGDSRRGGIAPQRESDPGAAPLECGARTASGRIRPRGQNRPHPLDGCDADHASPRNSADGGRRSTRAVRGSSRSCRGCSRSPRAVPR